MKRPVHLTEPPSLQVLPAQTVSDSGPLNFVISQADPTLLRKTPADTDVILFENVQSGIVF